MRNGKLLQGYGGLFPRFTFTPVVSRVSCIGFGRVLVGTNRNRRDAIRRGPASGLVDKVV